MKLTLRQFTVPCVLLGIIGVLLLDYWIDGCVSNIGGKTVCDSEALQYVLGLVGTISIFTIVTVIQLFRKNRNVKTLE